MLDCADLPKNILTPAMWTFRKAIIAAVAVLTIIFLLRSSHSASSSPATVDSSISQSSPSRSYPPPSSKKRPQNQISITGWTTKPLRDRLRYQFPYDLEDRFPAFIWQTWKATPGSKQFDEHLRPWEKAWSELHPGFIHEVVTDDAALHLVSYLYASVPEVIQAYTALPIPVLKADFFRYLILLARGGIYTDIDTEPLQPASDWLPEDFDRTTVGLIVGIEADPNRPDWQDWYSRRIQFCQWTIQAKPGHPVLREVVATITERTLQFKKDGLLKKSKLPLSIIEFTGPAVWTDAIFSYFNDRTFFDFSRRNSNISYSDFFDITVHKKLGDVVVLPITSFSPGVGQMGAQEVGDPMAFVRHDFEGSWKPDSERMRDN